MTNAFKIIDANTTIGAHPDHRLNLSIERLIKEMDAQKISRCLMQSTLGIFDTHERANSSVADAARTNDRLIPVATINPLRYFGSDDDIAKICAEGFRVFKFYPYEQDWDIESAAFGRIVRQLAKAKVPFMINVSGTGMPTSVANIAEGYPTPIILCSVSIENLSEALALMMDYPNIMIETHELHVPGALELIAEKAGADRIIFGSGAPRRSIASSLSYIAYSNLSGEQKQGILGNNIRRVLEGS